MMLLFGVAQLWLWPCARVCPKVPAIALAVAPQGLDIVRASREYDLRKKSTLRHLQGGQKTFAHVQPFGSAMRQVHRTKEYCQRPHISASRLMTGSNSQCGSRTSLSRVAIIAVPRSLHTRRHDGLGRGAAGCVPCPDRTSRYHLTGPVVGNVARQCSLVFCWWAMLMLLPCNT